MSIIEKALRLTKEALDMLTIEEDRQRNGEETVGTPSQLQKSRIQLEQMLRQLETGQLPPINRRLSGMGHMVGDSWPIDNPLGNALLDAEQAYKRAK